MDTDHPCPICRSREIHDTSVTEATEVIVATPIEEDLPKCVDYNGIFRFCGQCKVCAHQHGAFRDVDRRKVIISLICKSMKDVIHSHLSPDEYILGCCIGTCGRIFGEVGNQSGFYTSPGYEFITNYGRIAYFHRHMQRGGIWSVRFSEHATPYKLSQEYITIISYLSSYMYGDNSTTFFPEPIVDMVSLYNKHHSQNNI